MIDFKRIGLTVSMLLMLPVCLLAQNDAEKLSEARYAFDTAKDCDATLKALESISPEHQKQPPVLIYLAKAHECEKHWKKALEYYRAYLNAVPGAPGLVDKIGELNYKVTKQPQIDAQDQQAQAAKDQAEAARKEFQELQATNLDGMVSLANQMGTLSQISYHKGLSVVRYRITSAHANNCQLALKTNLRVENSGITYVATEELSIPISKVDADSSDYNYSGETPSGYHLVLKASNGHTFFHRSVSESGPQPGASNFSAEDTDEVEIVFESTDDASGVLKKIADLASSCAEEAQKRAAIH